MSMKRRLKKLEERLRPAKPAEPAWQPLETPEERAALERYYRGEGERPPFPPCPRPGDPAEWISRQRVGDQVGRWIYGGDAVGTFLPGLTEAERAQATE